MYFEAKGEFTLVKDQASKPGLAVIPAFDTEFLNEQKQDAAQVCRTSGAAQQTAKSGNGHCTNCDDDKWLPAIV